MNHSFSISFCIVFVVLSACNQSFCPESFQISDGSASLVTKAIQDVSFQGNDDYSVTDADVIAYLHFKELSAKSDGQTINVVSIIPFCTDSGTSIGYFINYSDGWELLSGDKRTPSILAMSPLGRIEPNCLPSEILSWFNQIAFKVLALKASSFTNSSHQSNLVFWEALGTAPRFISTQYEKKEPTRSVGDPIIDPLLPGHWELVNVWTGWHLIEDIPHLTQTNWHQDSPYNNFSPERNQNYTGRAPAGCLAIAGAQLLYYYHYKCGVPEYAPSQGSVTGVVNGYIQQQFWGESSTIWDSMQAIPDSAAFLIGSIGKAVHMHYGNVVSQAHLDSLVTCVMNPLSISSTYYSSYNKYAVIESLRSENPVLIRAGTNSGDVDYGHIFLIDLYKKYQRRTTYEYLYVYDIDPEEMQPLAPSYFEYEYHDLFYDMIGMNWGLGGSYNQILFEDDDSWVVSNPPGYDYNKRMYIFNYQ